MISIPHIPRYFNCIALSCFALFCIALQSFGTKLYIRLGQKKLLAFHCRDAVALWKHNCVANDQLRCTVFVQLCHTHIYMSNCAVYTPEEQLCYTLEVQLLVLVDVQLICNCFTIFLQVCNGKIVLYNIYTIGQLCNCVAQYMCNCVALWRQGEGNWEKVAADVNVPNPRPPPVQCRRLQ